MLRSQAIWSNSAHFDEFVISDQSNVFGSGDLDFVIVVENDGFHDLAGVVASSFAGFKTDVGYFPDFPGTPPSTIDRSTAGTVGFNFFDGIPRLSDTSQLVIETNATQFTSGFLTDGVRHGQRNHCRLWPFCTRTLYLGNARRWLRGFGAVAMARQAPLARGEKQSRIDLEGPAWSPCRRIPSRNAPDKQTRMRKQCDASMCTW